MQSSYTTSCRQWISSEKEVGNLHVHMHQLTVTYAFFYSAFLQTCQAGRTSVETHSTQSFEMIPEFKNICKNCLGGVRETTVRNMGRQNETRQWHWWQSIASTISLISILHWHWCIPSYLIELNSCIFVQWEYIITPVVKLWALLWIICIILIQWSRKSFCLGSCPWQGEFSFRWFCESRWCSCSWACFLHWLPLWKVAGKHKYVELTLTTADTFYNDLHPPELEEWWWNRLVHLHVNRAMVEWMPCVKFKLPN